MKKKNQCIELIKMFFYQYIYKCTSAKICYKMEKMKFMMYIKWITFMQRKVQLP